VERVGCASAVLTVCLGWSVVGLFVCWAGGRKMIKWLVLGLGSFELFAAYYSVDNPAALHDQLKEYFETSTQMDFEIFFNAMYTVYSVPNVVLPFLGGYLIDRYGPARMNTVFCSVLLVGQVITAIGVLVKYEYLALVGRTVFGVGAESLCVGVSVLLASWFLGSNVAFAMGLSLSISRVGSVVNNVLSGIVASSLALSFAFFLSAIFLTVGLVCAISVLQLEHKREDVEENPVDEYSEGDLQGVTSEKTPTFRSVLRFPLTYWILCISCCSVYACVIPFHNVISAFLIERRCGGSCCAPGNDQCDAHLEAEKSASYIMGIPYAISGILVPFLGLMVDRFGGRALLTLVSACSLFIVHMLLALTSVTAIGPLILLGLAYAVYAAALWPSIALVVPKAEVGLAYGLMTALQNLVLSIVPLLVGLIRNKSGSYSIVEVLFSCLAGVGIIAGIALNIDDTYLSNFGLNRKTTKFACREETKSLGTSASDDVTEKASLLLATNSDEPRSSEDTSLYRQKDV